MVNLNAVLESYNLDVLEETNEIRTLFFDVEDSENEPIVYRISADFNPLHYISFDFKDGGFTFNHLKSDSSVFDYFVEDYDGSEFEED